MSLTLSFLLPPLVWIALGTVLALGIARAAGRANDAAEAAALDEWRALLGPQAWAETVPLQPVRSSASAASTVVSTAPAPAIAA